MANDEPIIKLLGEKLKDMIHHRKNIGKFKRISDLELSVGYDYQSIYYWCTGERKIPKEVLPVLTKKLGTTVEEFLENTIQVSGKKMLINYSGITYYQIEKFGVYEGLTETEVKNVLIYKKQNPDKVWFH